MAPLAPSSKTPSARTLRQQRISGKIHPLLPSKTFRSDAAVTDAFLSTKRDKRLIKKSAFVSRIASARVSKTKRRRPGNKLSTSLDSLAAALPDLVDGGAGAELAGKIRHKSLKSRKGALKRKERVVKGEMERFGASMARLAGSEGAGVAASARSRPAGVVVDEDDDEEDDDDDEMDQQEAEPATSAATAAAAATAPTANRWAALRGYISATMEQNPAFAGQK